MAPVVCMMRILLTAFSPGGSAAFGRAIEPAMPPVVLVDG